jgi:putative membrane protein
VSRTHSRQTGETFFVWLLLTAGINVVALIFVNWIFDSVRIDGFWSYFLGALALTVGNAIIKPILALLTLPLIIVTFGLAYFAINVAMLALAEWIAPRFSVDGFWTYVGATIVTWAVNFVLGLLFDRLQGPNRAYA